MKLLYPMPNESEGDRRKLSNKHLTTEWYGHYLYFRGINMYILVHTLHVHPFCTNKHSDHNSVEQMWIQMF